MKHVVLPLVLLVAAPGPAKADCKTVLDDIRYQDQLVKRQGEELSARYGDIKSPDEHTSIGVKRDFVKGLNAYITNVNRDIDDLRWLVDHHCGPADLEPGAIDNVREMTALAQQLIKLRDEFLKRERL